MTAFKRVNPAVIVHSLGTVFALILTIQFRSAVITDAQKVAPF